ncbi:hypothetical protein EDB87DRAFT_1586611 [Lactarius vividus]|nr:hypothetical protein EDB87DRAFT_1586611 [Lactarius vividus]
MQAKSGVRLTKTVKCKQLELDAIPMPIRAAPPVPKKRARRDTLDENGRSGDTTTGERPHRVRQRLISTSSVVTIRPRKYLEDARPIKGISQSAALSCASTDSITPSSSEVLRPLSEINHSLGDTPHRRLRRVGAIEFPTMHGPVSDVSNQPSRIPVPVPVTFTRNSTPVGASERPKSFPCTLRHARESSVSYVASTTPGPASRASLDRFDLTIAPTKVHTELWDLDDDSLYAWPGILVLKDNQASVDFPAVHAVEIECATHAYEGRFSTETNALPVFSTFFRGAHLSKKELAESERVFDPSLGIIMQEDWSDAQVRKNQWYVKFWVPIPISLFRKKDTRMFRMRASVCVVDDRMWKKVTLHSGTVVADISHLRKHKDMDGATARA